MSCQSFASGCPGSPSSAPARRAALRWAFAVAVVEGVVERAAPIGRGQAGGVLVCGTSFSRGVDECRWSGTLRAGFAAGPPFSLCQERLFAGRCTSRSNPRFLYSLLGHAPSSRSRSQGLAFRPSSLRRGALRGKLTGTIATHPCRSI